MSDKELRNPEFEETLRNKMDELASSVDCFDKISRKAFPEQKTVSSDSEFAVCELENVTGRRRKIRFVPVMAAAAAIALCLFFLPKNDSFMNFVYSNIGKSDKKIFRELICEISEETEKYEYFSFDCTLEEFIENDVLISPLYGCPFEQNEKSGINVRIFIKMCGDVPTNQIYAVEYEGDYSGENYIAAADTNAKFTDEELESFGSGVTFGFSDAESENALAARFENKDDGTIGFYNESGNAVSAAGFTYRSLCKYEGTVYPVESEILYWHETADEENTEYYYDIASFYQSEQGTISLDQSTFSDGWSNSVYFNGTSAAAEKEQSGFVWTDIFGADADTQDKDSVLFIRPFDNEYATDVSGRILYLEQEGDSTPDVSVLSPLNPLLCLDYRMYFRDIGKNVILRTSVSELNVTYRIAGVREKCMEDTYDAEAEALRRQELEENAMQRASDEEALRAKEAEAEAQLQKEMEELENAESRMRASDAAE